MQALKTNVASPVTAAGKDYRYQRFTLPLMLQDLRFSRDALQPGEVPPEVALTELDGSGVYLSELLSAGPTVLVTGSLTCPMTSSSAPLINQLYREFSSDFQFVYLYVREAHPGELLRQPDSRREKAEHAQRFKSQLRIEPRIVIDDLDGTLHRLLDAKPNAAFVFDAQGRLAFRSLWASDQSGLLRALTALRDGRPLKTRQSTRMILPMLRAIGYVAEAMTRGGRRAHRDLLLAMPPMEAAGLLARTFRPLPRGLRGLAAIATMMGLAAATVFGIFAFV